MSLRPCPKPKKRKKRERMPGSSLPRPSKAMARGAGPSRKSRMPRENRARKKKRQEAGVVYGPFYDYVRERGRCQLATDPRHTCKGPLDAHHIHHAGNGGLDERNLIDLCRGAHRWSRRSVHQMGPDSFEAYWKINMQARADVLWDAYLAHLRRTAGASTPGSP